MRVERFTLNKKQNTKSLQTSQALADHSELLFKVFVGIQFGFLDLFDVSCAT